MVDPKPVPPENSIWALLGAVGAMKIAAVREVRCPGARNARHGVVG